MVFDILVFHMMFINFIYVQYLCFVSYHIWLFFTVHHLMLPSNLTKILCILFCDLFSNISQCFLILITENFKKNIWQIMMWNSLMIFHNILRNVAALLRATLLVDSWQHFCPCQLWPVPLASSLARSTNLNLLYLALLPATRVLILAVVASVHYLKKWYYKWQATL